MPSASQLISSAQNLLAQALAFAGNRAPSWATGDRDFLGKVARMFVAMLNSNQATLRQLDADWPPSSQSSAESLQRNATTFGLPNGAGGYGFRSQSQRWAVWESCKAHQGRRSPAADVHWA